ncbi:MAG TPA: aminoglycoside phosphotransferase family protein [Steroidobacteraceae bacterium]|nr:aminoglycoside phosphotransferase family protein [Steroidobacteraceae bacterium]
MSGARREARLRRVARYIFEQAAGTAPGRIRVQEGGRTNHVFVLENPDGAFVLRMDEQDDKVHQYRKERWAIDHARRMDIPAPNVIEVGTTPDGVSFMLSRREPGRPATDRDDALAVLRQLGQYARKLHGETLGQFGGHQGGETAPWTGWEDFLRHEYDMDRRLYQLLALGLLDEFTARRVADVVLRLGEGREPRLNHGDLRLKNVLVEEGSGRITAIIDWENAIAAPSPEWDLALALHDLSVDQKDAFLDGYGIEHEELVAARSTLAALNLLHYAPFADDAARTGDEQRLRHYRRRFARLHDLYSP